MKKDGRILDWIFAGSSIYDARVASTCSHSSAPYSPSRLNPLAQPWTSQALHDPTLHRQLTSDPGAALSRARYNPVLGGAATLAAGEQDPASADQYIRAGPSLPSHTHPAPPSSLGAAMPQRAQPSGALAQASKQTATDHLRTTTHRPPHIGKTPKRPAALPVASKDTRQVRDQDEGR